MPQLDYSPGLHPGPNGSAVRGVVIVPSDGVQLPFVARRLWVGTGGNMRVMLRDDQVPVDLANVPAGTLHMWVKQVFATGTTATNLVALA